MEVSRDVTVYPGQIISAGSQNTEANLVIQRRLNEMGCGEIDESGIFDHATVLAIELFQMRFPDVDGYPLDVDGVVGPITWAAMFGDKSIGGNMHPTPPLLGAVLNFARTQIGVLENPLGSNRGPEIDLYVKSVGLDPAGHHAWCVAFIYFGFIQASADLRRKNPMVRTGHVLDHWRRSEKNGGVHVPASAASGNPSLVRPGQIFVISHGGGLGHSGLVEKVSSGKLTTIEGNTNGGGSRDGIGVFRREQRKISSINVGFIDYGSA